jgi:predicted alpha/beta superfamily hydrolase
MLVDSLRGRAGISRMDRTTFSVGGKEAVLYVADVRDRPLIVLNNYAGDGQSIVNALRNLGCPDFNLLCIGGLRWDHDMTPWCCPPIFPGDAPCTGGADEYLRLLLAEIVPQAEGLIFGRPAHVSIAGYSLAGLFALYALYRCDAFKNAASMSGSLWFPGFREFVVANAMKRKPGRVYLSLGDREAKTENEFLRSVQRNTEEIVEHYRRLGLDVVWELNRGDHIKNAALRSAKGIRAIL